MPTLEETDQALILALSQLVHNYGFAGVVNTLSQMQQKGLSNFPPPDDRKPTFEIELTKLLNRFHWDTNAATPDYLLASMLLGHLNAYNMCRSRRDSWFGQDMKIEYKKKMESSA